MLARLVRRGLADAPPNAYAYAYAWGVRFTTGQSPLPAGGDSCAEASPARALKAAGSTLDTKTGNSVWEEQAAKVAAHRVLCS